MQWKANYSVRDTLILPAYFNPIADFIDKLYRFGYSIAAESRNEKIQIFLEPLDPKLDNFAECALTT